MPFTEIYVLSFEIIKLMILMSRAFAFAIKEPHVFLDSRPCGTTVGQQAICLLSTGKPLDCEPLESRSFALMKAGISESS